MSAVVFGDSDGFLIPQQAAYDVIYYDLDLVINPEEKTISGSLLVQVEIVDDLDSLVLDLDDVFTIDSVLLKNETSDFSQASLIIMRLCEINNLTESKKLLK